MNTSPTFTSTEISSLAQTRTRPVTAAYFVAFVALGLTTASLGPTLSGLGQQTQASLQTISVLFPARSLGLLLGSFLSGRLYDRLPGHRVLGSALLLMTVMMMLIPTVSQFWWLAAAMLLLGAAEGAVLAGGNTLLVWLHGERSGAVMNALHFFYGLGAFLSPIVMAQAMQTDFSLAYRILAVPALPAAIWLFLLPSPISQATHNAKSPAGINWRMTFFIACFLFLYVGAEVSFGSWIYNYALALKLTTATVAAWLTSAFWGAFTLGRLFGVVLALRFRLRMILLFDLLGALLSVLLILWLSSSFVAVWIGTIGIGLAMASIFPTMLSFAGQQMKITGQVTGSFLVGASSGAMFLPWLIGQFFETIHPRTLPLVVAVSLSIALTLFGTASHRAVSTSTEKA